MIVSNPDLVRSSGVMDLTISDYFLVYTTLNLRKPKLKTSKLLVRSPMTQNRSQKIWPMYRGMFYHILIALMINLLNLVHCLATSLTTTHLSKSLKRKSNPARLLPRWLVAMQFAPGSVGAIGAAVIAISLQIPKYSFIRATWRQLAVISRSVFPT
jgi:hypothetical protein